MQNMSYWAFYDSKKIIQASFLSFCDSLATSKTSINLVSNKTEPINALIGLLVKESSNGHHCNQLLRKINRYVVTIISL